LQREDYYEYCWTIATQAALTFSSKYW
jgi:hypothetical protein